MSFARRANGMVETSVLLGAMPWSVHRAPPLRLAIKAWPGGRTVEQDRRPIQNRTQFEDSQSSLDVGPSQFDDIIDDSNEFDDGFDYGL